MGDPSQPWLFVVDALGNVSSTFEGGVSQRSCPKQSKQLHERPAPHFAMHRHNGGGTAREFGRDELAVVAEELGSLSEAGLATRDPGPFGGWSITEQGRRHDDQDLGLELAAVEISEEVNDAYRRFSR